MLSKKREAEQELRHKIETDMLCQLYELKKDNHRKETQQMISKNNLKLAVI